MIEIREERNGEILILNIVRPCDIGEIVDTIKRHYCKGYDFILWNFNKGTISHLTRESFIEMAIAEKNCCGNIKAACVGENDLEFGMLQMYYAYAKNIINHEVRIFRNEADGILWFTDCKMVL